MLTKIAVLFRDLVLLKRRRKANKGNTGGCKSCKADGIGVVLCSECQSLKDRGWLDISSR